MTLKKMSQGFTIVELLIVIIVIAILAAITIVAFTGVQDRARTSSLQTSASQASRKLMNYATLNNETYPANKADFLTATGVIESSTLGFTYQVTADGKKYCVSATDPTKSSQIPQAYTNFGGVGTGTCIRNMSNNPRAVSGIGGYGGRYSTSTSWVTGAGDGPIGITSYNRQTIVTPVSGSGRGFDFNSNLDNVSPAVNTNWPVVSGQPYTVSIYVRSTVGNSATLMRCRTHDGVGGSWIGTMTQSPDVVSSPNQWHRLSITHTPSANGYLACTARFNTTVSWTAGATMDATGLMVTEGSDLYNFADGSTTGWTWEGATGSTQSIGLGLNN